MIKIKHQLSNFDLDLGFEVNPQGTADLLKLGLKKAADSAGAKYFVTAAGKQVKDRRVEKPFDEAEGKKLVALIEANLLTAFKGNVSLRESAVTRHAWTDGKEEEFAKAFESYTAALKIPGVDDATARLISRYTGPAGGPGAVEAAPSEVEGAEEGEQSAVQ